MATLFFSYSHIDENLRDQLETHLSGLRRQGLISSWHDRRITAGEDFGEAIDSHINTADVILLLVSPDFIASDYCYEREMKRALERHQRDDARVIPVILRPCDWHDLLLESSWRRQRMADRSRCGRTSMRHSWMLSPRSNAP